MLCQIEVRAVSDALELAEALLAGEGERVLDVGAAAVVTRVVCELVPVVIAQAEVVAREAELAPPLVATLPPELVPVVRLARVNEELDLHHLELPRPEDEVAGGDLVAEALAELRKPERHLHASRVEDV